MLKAVLAFFAPAVAALALTAPGAAATIGADRATAEGSRSDLGLTGADHALTL